MCCYEDSKLLKLFTDIVRMLYDNDILAEDTINWWAKKVSPPPRIPGIAWQSLAAGPLTAGHSCAHMLVHVYHGVQPRQTLESPESCHRSHTKTLGFMFSC